MSGKLDQSLDEILSDQRRTAGRRRSTRRTSTKAKVAPVGGIQKNTKPTRGASTKATPAKSTGAVGESKIVVSNLPTDVSEAQIKDYFSKTVSQVKKVELSYGPRGVSRGIATVIFHHSDGASKAFSELNGLMIDNRPVKVEVVVAKAELIPQPKTLGQRITAPKPKPKSAATDKARSAAAAKPAAGKGAAKKTGRRPRNSRPAKKTAEELDSEMADYFESGANNSNNNNGTAAPAAAATNGAAAPAANGDAAMDDDIM